MNTKKSNFDFFLYKLCIGELLNSYLNFYVFMCVHECFCMCAHMCK